MCAFGRFPPEEVISVNLISGSGECGVHIAAGLGRLEMLKVRETYICINIIRIIIILLLHQVLVAHGANLGVADQQGDSAVYWAARQGHAPVIR